MTGGVAAGDGKWAIVRGSALVSVAFGSAPGVAEGVTGRTRRSSTRALIECRTHSRGLIGCQRRRSTSILRTDRHGTVTAASPLRPAIPETAETSTCTAAHRRGHTRLGVDTA